mgnify:CR=1 FL=1
MNETSNKICTYTTPIRSGSADQKLLNLCSVGGDGGSGGDGGGSDDGGGR